MAAISKMDNQRNYYRILHVQFDAPCEIIKSSYRTLMQTLRFHPDLGGDDWNAQLLNEALAVLTDPHRRAQHDRWLIETSRIPKTRRGAGRASATAADTESSTEPETGSNTGSNTGSSTGSSTGPEKRQRSDPPASAHSGTSSIVTMVSGRHCPFCHCPVHEHRSELAGYTLHYRCRQCNGPLQAVIPVVSATGAGRQLHRTEQVGSATLWLQWPKDGGYSARIIDWSTSGCALQLPMMIANGVVVQLQTGLFDALGQVRYGHAVETGQAQLGLEFLTLELKTPPGSVFRSTV